MKHMIDEEGRDKRISEQTDVRRRCPFVEDPFEDCLTLDTTSPKLEALIYYCGGNFEQCEVYKRKGHKIGKEAKNEG